MTRSSKRLVVKAKRKIHEQSPLTSAKKSRAKPRRRSAVDSEKPYRPPSVLRLSSSRTPSPYNPDQGTFGSKKQARRLQRLRIKTNKNGRDPFVILDDDVVYQIFTYLSAADTEYIRRVSKLWKICSEIHCGMSALRRHFIPWTTWPVSFSRTDANLHFRRWLYYAKSLKRGFATKATVFTDVHSWQIETGRLMLADHDGNATIKSLDHQPDPDRQVNIQTLLGSEVDPIEVQLTKQGDLLVKALKPYLDYSTAWACGNSAISPTPCTYIFLVSMNDGEPRIKWQKRIDADIAGPAIGKSSIYVLEGSSDLNERAKVRRFTKFALVNGETQHCVDLVQSTTTHKPNMLASGLHRKQLAVSFDEDLVVWGGHGWVSTHCTSTFKHYRSRERRHNPLWLSCYNKGYWLLTQYRRIEHRWNHQSPHRQFDITYGFYPLTGETQFDSHIAFRNDMHVLDDETHKGICVSHPDDECPTDWSGSGQKKPHDTLDPFAGFIIGNWKTPLEVPITLPSRDGSIGRRPLETALPWFLDPADESHFLGMQDGYVVYFSREEARLIVIDFWPTW